MIPVYGPVHAFERSSMGGTGQPGSSLSGAPVVVMGGIQHALETGDRPIGACGKDQAGSETFWTFLMSTASHEVRYFECPFTQVIQASQKMP